MDPETRAKAQLLREQTEQADWSNRLLSSQVPLAESAAGSVGGILSATGSDIGAGAPTVAGTLSSVAQPPSNFNTAEGSKGSAGRGVVSSANMTPYQRYVANEVIAGRMSPEALKTAINIGQSADAKGLAAPTPLSPRGRRRRSRQVRSSTLPANRAVRQSAVVRLMPARVTKRQAPPTFPSPTRISKLETLRRRTWARSARWSISTIR